MTEDVVFFSSLFVCISLGGYYKKIEDLGMKRNYGVGLGILVVCLICGQNAVHSLLLIWGNIIIIKCCDKRYLHLISLCYTWLYLLYLHFNISYSFYVISMYQTIALRLVGLAFEVNIASKTTTANPNDSKTSSNSALDVLSTEPTAVDVISYSLFFIGLHKGPYYRWKTFNDHFNSSFVTSGDCRIITEQKLKKALFCGISYALLRMKYSPELYYQDEFYKNYSADSRYLYNLPQLMMYFLQYQMIMMLCTSVCTETGFGVYPAKCKPVPGQGPTTSFDFLKLVSETKDITFEEEFNFSMLKCFNNERIIAGPKMSDTLRAWDMPTRYWFWAYPYKHLVKSTKRIRSAVRIILWTVWRGPSPQQIILSATLFVYLHLEAEYTELYDTRTSLKMAWNFGFAIMRMLCLIYLAPCLVVDDTRVILRYYCSMFWIYHIVLIALIILAFVVSKQTRTEK